MMTWFIIFSLEDDEEDEDEDDYDYEEEAEIPVNDIRVSACTVRDAEPDHWATFLEAEEDYDDDDYEDYDEEDDDDNFHEELWNSRFPSEEYVKIAEEY